MTDNAAKREAFRHLHKDGLFIMPNAFDAGSGKILQSLGFEAIASSSAGFAWTIGKPDNGVTLEEVLEHLTALCAAVDIPVNADFENAFADDPEGVAANVVKCAATGVAGLSVEDHRDTAHPLYDAALAVDRVRAARLALNEAAPDCLLVARTEGLLGDRIKPPEAIARLVAFAEAGADVLFAPGLRAPADIESAVRAIAPLPLSMIAPAGMSAADLAALGVRRISVGGSLARVAYGAVIAASGEMAESGTFAALSHGAPGKALNDLFAGRNQLPDKGWPR
jgi:2-methylisocitrate lyase-like PEP mutase family enzyme